MKQLGLGVMFALFVMVAASCGASEIGEECEGVGSTDDCVDGAICTNEEGTAARCRKLCEDTAECGMGEACNGISSSNQKSCQPD